VARGPYTGCLGYFGFNRESAFNLLIRTAVCLRAGVWFHAGAGIVADSDPAAEWEETMAKGRAFAEAVNSVPAGRWGASRGGTRTSTLHS